MSHSQAESQSWPCIGYHSSSELESSGYHPIQQPRILPATTDLARKFGWLSRPTEGLNLSSAYASRRCCILNNFALVCIIILITLLSILVGVLVGVFAHSASLGIAATSAFAAILSSIAGALLLRSHRHDQ